MKLDHEATEILIDKITEVSARLMSALIREFGPEITVFRKELRPIVAFIALCGIGTNLDETHEKQCS